ncbi:low molecular weight protein-tyrosine-phosphatase [Pseudohaliea sp.]|uniref:low molecular weight protein-tyrosine-phosphatase n=1 Tax=Pseudohaliea sp. TaxID=2740289 RepID=UPI0032EDE8B7
MSGETGVLFVCLGNICRSPTADAVFREQVARAGLAGRVRIDSCGTAGYHVGEPPDARATAAAARRGYDLSPLRARQFDPADFERFDYILAMDESNLAHLEARRPEGYRGRLDLFLALAPALGRREVPDPYYGGERGFEEVLDLVEQAGEALLAELTGAGRG